MQPIYSFRTASAKIGFDQIDLVKQFIQKSLQNGTLAAPPTVRMLHAVAGFPYRPEPKPTELITVIGQVTYASNTRSKGILQWQNVADVVAREEPKTLTYWFLADKENEEILFDFERFTDSEAKKFHADATIIAENIQSQKDIRIGLKLRFWIESEESFYRTET
jgi:hypothetical protein